MDRPINFLPWRQWQRAACIRFWSVMFSASLVVLAGLFTSYFVMNLADEHVNAVLLDGEQRRASVIATSKPPLLALQQRFQLALKQQHQREQTLRWQADLENLAALLPAQAWLTELVFQQEKLTLTGRALTFGALGALEASLRRQPAFQLSHTGATQQDEQGHWRFQYQLIRSRQDDVSY
ncbi:TPA: PilN domain-containing protein [Citrobacter freundii]